MEIIKKVSSVKSLIRFRSVSKPWKSFIDNSKFIKGYGAHHTQPHSGIFMYRADLEKEVKRYRFVDDDKDETFEVQEQEFAPFVVSPLLEQYHVSFVVDTCHGLLCLYCYNKDNHGKMLVIWNPCIGKSFGIALGFLQMNPVYHPDPLVFGFGVCPDTRDPTIVKIYCEDDEPWHVEVFTLSSGVWNVIPRSNLPRKSVGLNLKAQVVIDRFIYWGASKKAFTHYKYMLVSFDIITKEFKVIDLPDSLTNELCSCCSVSRLRESLVVYGSIYVDGARGCNVWVMEHDSSFRNLFTIGAPVDRIVGFKKNGETIFETDKEDEAFSTLNVYNPRSKRIKNLGIFGEYLSFFMGTYKESLLLLDHLDSHIYYDHYLSK